jgi:hypothetical protein
VQLTRNNPFALTYEDIRVEAAPGSGLAITTFLEQLTTPAVHTRMKSLPRIVQGHVVHIVPGDLQQKVVYLNENGSLHTFTTPILINALGLGEPLPLSRSGVIETTVPDAEGGIRWQHPITLQDAETLRGKHVVFVGLGNSTIEMVVQLQKWNTLGYNISYKILTHHSHEALEYPTHADRSGYQLYRDVTHPRLTRLAGDLAPIDSAFRQAWDSRDSDQEEIIPDVCRWNIEHEAGQQWIVIQTRWQRSEIPPRRFAFDRLYTLIGYGHSPEQIHTMGLTRVGETTSLMIAHDCDGEFQKQVGHTGRDRLYPGYFGFGALLSAPNAQVIAGMFYRLPDLLVGVTMRATESLLRNRGSQKRR